MMAAVTVPSGHVVATMENARQLLAQDPNSIVSDLKALLAHPTTTVVNFAFAELRARKAI
jgi:hypothetical protein